MVLRRIPVRDARIEAVTHGLVGERALGDSHVILVGREGAGELREPQRSLLQRGKGEIAHRGHDYVLPEGCEDEYGREVPVFCRADLSVRELDLLALLAQQGEHNGFRATLRQLPPHEGEPARHVTLTLRRRMDGPPSHTLMPCMGSPFPQLPACISRFFPQASMEE